MDEFEKVLLQYQKSRCLVIDPPGGKGDQLILMGMEKKLRELNINYTILRYKKQFLFDKLYISLKEILSPMYSRYFFNPLHPYYIHLARNMTERKISKTMKVPAEVVLIRGGGYFNDLWKDYDILTNTIKNNPDSVIIVAPHSFFFKNTQFPKIFRFMKSEAHLFCRERHSYDLVQLMHFPENIHVHLSCDTALYLSKKDFDFENEANSYVLIAPRDDRESVVNWKIERHPKGMRILFGDAENVSGFKAFVNLVGNAYEVYTDRLHVATLAGILDKDTFLYPNSYHKNKGVYEFSLHEFPNIRFVDSLKFLGHKAPV